MKTTHSIFLICYLMLLVLYRPSLAADITIGPDDFGGDFGTSAKVEVSNYDSATESHFSKHGAMLNGMTTLGYMTLEVNFQKDVSESDIAEKLPSDAEILDYEFVFFDVFQQPTGSGQSGEEETLTLDVPQIAMTERGGIFTYRLNTVLRVNYQISIGPDEFQNYTKDLEAVAYFYLNVTRPYHIEQGSDGDMVNLRLIGHSLNAQGGTDSFPMVGEPVGASLAAPYRQVWPDLVHTGEDGVANFLIITEPEAYSSDSASEFTLLADVSGGTLTLDFLGETTVEEVPLPKYFATVDEVTGIVYIIDKLSGSERRAKVNDGLVVGDRLYGEVEITPYGSVYPAITISYKNQDYLEDLPLLDNLNQPLIVEIGPRGSTPLGKQASPFEIGLEQLKFDAAYQPQELARFVVKQTLGRLAEAVTGGYGFLTKNLLGEIVSYSVESASDLEVKTPPPQQPKFLQKLNINNGLSSDITPAFVPTGGISLSHTVFSNGTINFENTGESMMLTSETGATLVLPGGASTTIDVLTNTPSGASMALPVRSGSQGDEVALIPSNGSTIDTLSPTIIAKHTTFGWLELIDPQNATMWVNNVNISSRLSGDFRQHSYVVPLESPLIEGENRVEVLLRTRGGGTYRREATFLANSDQPRTPYGLLTLAGSNTLSIRWKPNRERDLAGYRIYRSETGGDPWSYLGTTTETLWIDRTPPNSTFYRVTAVDRANRESDPSNVVEASLRSSDPPAAAKIDEIYFENEQGHALVGVRELGSNTVGYVIERAISAGGPFTALHPTGTVIGQTRFVDETALPGSEYYYRFTPVNFNALLGDPAIGGPFMIADVPPPPPTGLAFDIQEDQIVIRWNPADFPDVSGYRLYRWTQVLGWRLLNPSALLTETAYVEEPDAGKNLRLYAIAAVDSLGREGDASPSLSLSFQTSSTQSFKLRVKMTGKGVVTSSPAGIDCGSDCSESFAQGTKVTLTAKPDTGMGLGGWTGACTGKALTCTLSMTAAKTATVTFVPLTVGIGDVSLGEGNSGTKMFPLEVSLSGTSASKVTVKYATANSSATAGSDYTAVPTPTLITFPAGQTTKTVNITVKGDTIKEANETFFVNLTSPMGATIADAQGTGTILNDDGPVLKINNVSKAEGNSGTVGFTFTVTLSPANNNTVTVKYTTADGTATAGSDYTAVSTPVSIIFSPGQTRKAISIDVKGDTTKEANETFFVNIKSPIGATIFDGQGKGTIANDD